MITGHAGSVPVHHSHDSRTNARVTEGQSDESR